MKPSSASHQARPALAHLVGRVRRLLRRRAASAPPCPARLHGQPNAAGRRIPPTIWMYWEQAEMPAVVQLCIARLRRLHPQHTLHVLTPATLQGFVPELPWQLQQVAVEKRADWIRLDVLKRYGGIWVDASMIAMQSLDWVHQLQQDSQAEYVGFHIAAANRNPDFPVVENWFMACVPDSHFIASWHAVFTEQVIVPGAANYLARLQQEGRYDALVQGITSPEYLSMHVAAQQVLQAEGASHALALLCAEDSAFFYHQHSGWSRRRLHIALLLDQAPVSAPALIKLRGYDRKHLDTYLRHDCARHDSVLGELAREAGLAQPAP